MQSAFTAVRSCSRKVVGCISFRSRLGLEFVLSFIVFPCVAADGGTGSSKIQPTRNHLCELFLWKSPYIRLLCTEINAQYVPGGIRRGKAARGVLSRLCQSERARLASGTGRLCRARPNFGSAAGHISISWTSRCESRLRGIPRTGAGSEEGKAKEQYARVALYSSDRGGSSPASGLVASR